jgi:anti-sigma B factor antagonist
MEIKVNKEGQILILIIDGDLDASSAILLDQEIENALKQEETKILVNCTQLEYISSAGLGVFMSYLQDFEEKQVEIVLFGMSEKVHNVFKILGLDNLLRIVNTKEEAQNLLN